MASTYSSDLKLELMATGENAGTWGDKTNTNLNLIQQAVAGYEAIALSDGGTVALAMTDATISNARNMILKFTGTLTTASIVTIPDSIEKFYIIDLSAVTGVTNLTIKTASGTGFTAGEAKIVAAYSDGTNLNEIALDTLGGTIATAQIADNAVTTAKISDNQVTTAKISDNQVTSAKISDNQIVTAKISDLQVTTAKIADDAVTPDKLSDTAVTPGTFTSATITVDQQGRITAASSGSAGAGGYEMVLRQGGPVSANYTASPTANKTTLLMVSAGGGSGRTPTDMSQPMAPGAGGLFYLPVAQSSPSPYVIGARGNVNGGPNRPGNSAQSSNFGTTITFTGGTGASPNASGTPGSSTGTTTADFTTNPPINYNLFPSNAGLFNNEGYIMIFENIGT